MRIAFIFATIGIALETLLAAPAQAYPVNQIQLTVPFPAGGTTDVLARELGARLSKELDVTVIIQNRPGASATVGSQFVARAAPDGSQLLLGSTHHVINPTLQKSLPYDTKKDFTDIALVALVPNALVVNPDLPVRSVADLIKLAKEKPGTLNFGSPGVGSANHLAGELFKSMAGIDMMHVPYPGAAPAMANLIGGHIQVMFDSLPTVLANAEAGKLRILAVTNGERVSSLPDTPTIAEAGNLPGYSASAWFGLYAPAGLSDEARTALEQAMKKIMSSEDIALAFKKLGVEPGNLAGAPFKAFVESEITKWGKVVESAKTAEK